MPRLFVAIELPDDVKQQLTRLRGDIPGATWVKPHAYHLTLRFLGDQIEAARVPAIVSALEAVQATPFDLVLQGVGRFPPKGSARVLWVGLNAPPALMSLHRAVESALDTVGFPPESRPFSAHITLARLKQDARQQVDAFLSQYRQFRTEPIAVSSFHLIESTLTPQGPKYRHEATFNLGS